MGKQAKGWTHPDHWLIAALGTLCEIGAIALVIVAILVTPLFTDRREKPEMSAYKITNTDIKCEDNYCYHSKYRAPASDDRTHTHDMDNKKNPTWLDTARILVFVGAGSNALSLAMMLVIFWPVVLCGRALNIVLHISRFVNFIGAPPKFIGSFCLLWHIAEINNSHSWQKYGGTLQIDTLPIGLLLYSYILQTLGFVCGTVATDVGARGQDSHIEILKARRMFSSISDDQSGRVSYHPIDAKRSSKVLAEVENHYTRHESNV